jgi:hypothetical protein
MTEPIQVIPMGEPELPPETVTERALEEIIQGSRVIHERHQGFAKAIARKLLAAEAERDAALAANELDRRNLHGIVSQIEAEITGRMWLIEGRGSYEWDDDKYRQEFGWAVHAIQKKLELLRKITRDLTNSPTKESGVERVRQLEKVETELATARQTIERLSAPVSDAECNVVMFRVDSGHTFGAILDALIAARKDAKKS